MMEYKELVEQLRNCATTDVCTEECKYITHDCRHCKCFLLADAADAIEELLASCKNFEDAMKDLVEETAWIPVTEKKEREKMNGECVTCTIDNPTNWEEYQAMPEALKEAYISHLWNEYEVTPAMLAMMWRKDRRVCGFEQRRFKIGQAPSRGRVSHKKMERWEAFLQESES